MEKKRAEALAELDRAKTAFFCNVSHEFRAPLTLIPGPVEEALKQPSESLDGANLQAVHRSAIRLLKLVIFEGTGIGLSLVQELVKLHAGTVRASSVEGQGSTFQVSIPTGSAHLPPERITGERERVHLFKSDAPYLREASQWIGADPPAPVAELPSNDAAPLSPARRASMLPEENLLMLSGITRAPLRRQRVDIAELSRQILSDLESREPERKVDMDVAPELVAQADPRLIAVVLENLLGNSWKFTSKRRHPRIEIGQAQRPEKAFFVRDNGAGFDMAHAHRLFSPFQRLHSETEFEGTGIGLATIQRIISRHEGRVWAEAARDQGATFFFTLGDVQ